MVAITKKNANAALVYSFLYKIVQVSVMFTVHTFYSKEGKVAFAFSHRLIFCVGNTLGLILLMKCTKSSCFCTDSLGFLFGFCCVSCKLLCDMYGKTTMALTEYIPLKLLHLWEHDLEWCHIVIGSFFDLHLYLPNTFQEIWLSFA